jgi:hypothetical protein
VVAHSHGGNVALHAADQLRAVRHKARVTTVALATPFLHARARQIAGWPLFVIVLFSVLLLGSATGTAVTGSDSPADTALVAGGGAFAATVMLAPLARTCIGDCWDRAGDLSSSPLSTHLPPAPTRPSSSGPPGTKRRDCW